MSDEQYSPPRPESRSGCLRALGITCLVLVVLILVFMFLGVYMLRRSPAFKRMELMSQCSNNLSEIGRALGRYKSRKGSYPVGLAELYPMFLEKQETLHCPADPSPKAVVSYKYFPPAKNASGKTVVAKCEHHQLMKSPVVLTLYLDGSVELTTPQGSQSPVRVPAPSG